MYTKSVRNSKEGERHEANRQGRRESTAGEVRGGRSAVEGGAGRTARYVPQPELPHSATEGHPSPGSLADARTVPSTVLPSNPGHAGACRARAESTQKCAMQRLCSESAARPPLAVWVPLFSHMTGWQPLMTLHPRPGRSVAHALAGGTDAERSPSTTSSS